MCSKTKTEAREVTYTFVQHKLIELNTLIQSLRQSKIHLDFKKAIHYEELIEQKKQELRSLKWVSDFVNEREPNGKDLLQHCQSSHKLVHCVCPSKCKEASEGQESCKCLQCSTDSNCC